MVCRHSKTASACWGVQCSGTVGAGGAGGAVGIDDADADADADAGAGDADGVAPALIVPACVIVWPRP